MRHNLQIPKIIVVVMKRMCCGKASNNYHDAETPKEHEIERYRSFPLLCDLLQHEHVRNASFRRDGILQMQYPLSTAGWVPTFLTVRGRALDNIIFPWLFAVTHAAAYVVVAEEFLNIPSLPGSEAWEVFFAFVIHGTLSLLLVFRLNRAATRFWISRQYWGDIVARSRSLGSSIIAHGGDPLQDETGSSTRMHREDALRWLAAYAISTKNLLRATCSATLNADTFRGILCDAQIEKLRAQHHPPMFCADQLRYHLNRTMLPASIDTPTTIVRAQQLDRMESQLNELIWFGGGMERIKATPLPIVYVTHLRTFILVDLLMMPYIYGPSWGYWTIPIVAAASFAWLGIESAAMEVEAPFRINRVNALNMDLYIMGILSTLQQQMKQDADRCINGSS